MIKTQITWRAATLKYAKGFLCFALAFLFNAVDGQLLTIWSVWPCLTFGDKRMTCFPCCCLGIQLNFNVEGQTIWCILHHNAKTTSLKLYNNTPAAYIAQLVATKQRLNASLCSEANGTRWGKIPPKAGSLKLMTHFVTCWVILSETGDSTSY